MKICTLPGGDEVHRFDRSLLVSFGGKRKVLSTAPYQGGYRTDLDAVLNHDGNYGRGCLVEMKADTYRDHMRLTMKEIGLPEGKTAGLETAAQMENASIVTESYRDLAVTAITTAGIEASGGRVGDPAVWYEESEKKGLGKEKKDSGPSHCGQGSQSIKPGTINTILCIDADLYEGALVRALVTAAEAKAAALQELLAPSVNSHGIATGSGTDGIIVIANIESELFLTDAGKFSKLGELIGRTVKKSVKEALFLQNGMNSVSQHSIVKRLSRFGLSEAGLYQKLIREYGKDLMPRHQFSDRLFSLDSTGNMVGLVSCIAHLLDQYDWGLLKEEEVAETVNEIFSLTGYRGRIGKITDGKMKKTGHSDRKDDPFAAHLLDHVERMVIETCLRVRSNQ